MLSPMYGTSVSVTREHVRVSVALVGGWKKKTNYLRRTALRDVEEMMDGEHLYHHHHQHDTIYGVLTGVVHILYDGD